MDKSDTFYFTAKFTFNSLKERAFSNQFKNASLAIRCFSQVLNLENQDAFNWKCFYVIIYLIKLIGKFPILQLGRRLSRWYQNCNQVVKQWSARSSGRSQSTQCSHSHFSFCFSQPNLFFANHTTKSCFRPNNDELSDIRT